jgi:hypothetical protein
LTDSTGQSQSHGNGSSTLDCCSADSRFALLVLCLRLIAARQIAQRLREGRSTKPSLYTTPHLYACIYPRREGLAEVMMSSVINRTSHNIVRKTIHDHMCLAQRLVNTWNSTQRAAAEGAAAAAPPVLQLASVTHAQLNALSALQPPDTHVKAKIFGSDIYGIFHFCALYGSGVMSAGHAAWVTSRMEADNSTPLLPDVSWLKALVAAVKDLTYLPTESQLLKMQADKPWLKSQPTVAEYLISRMIYCRDTTESRKRQSASNRLQPGDPTLCTKADQCQSVVQTASAMYMQRLKALGQTHWAGVKKNVGLPSEGSSHVMPCWLRAL